MKALHFLCLTPLVAAFFPTKFRDGLDGRPGVSHESLTIDALSQLAHALDTITGSSPGSPVEFLPRDVAVAIRAMARANAEVDLLETTDAAWHFDGEKIHEGQLLLSALRSAVIDALQREDGTMARALLGKALHGVQDFYAHTNWLELGKSQLAPLGRSVAMEVAAETDSTCSGCNNSGKGAAPFAGSDSVCQDCVRISASSVQLTSGFFVEKDAQPVVGGKCRHGGPMDNLGSKASANVTAPALSAPYPVAANSTLPLNATGTSGLSSTTSTGLSSVNATSGLDSPSDETPLFIAGINKDSLDCLWSPHSHLHKDAAAFATAASKQFVEDLLDELSPQQLRVLFGLPAEQIFAEVAENVTTAAPTMEFSASTRAASLTIPGAIGTAKRDEHEAFDPLAMLSMAPMLLVDDVLPHAKDPASFPFMVDSNMSFLSVGIACSACSVVLSPPDADQPLGSDWSQAVDESGTHARMNVTSPQNGLWNVQIAGTESQKFGGSFALVAEGQSPVDLVSFDFVENAGRPGHEGYFGIGDIIPVDTVIGAVAEMYGSVDSSVQTTWVLRERNFHGIHNTSEGHGRVGIQTLNLIPGSGEFGFPDNKTYFGTTKLPSTMLETQQHGIPSAGFYIYVRGVDAHGADYQRVHPIQFTTSKATREYRMGSLSPLFDLANGASTTAETAMKPVERSNASVMAAAVSIEVSNSTTLYPFPLTTPVATQKADEEDENETAADNITKRPFATSLFGQTFGSGAPGTAAGTGTAYSTGIFYPTPSGIHRNGTASGLPLNGTAIGTGYATATGGHVSGVTVSAADPTGFNRTRPEESGTLTIGPTKTVTVDPVVTDSYVISTGNLTFPTPYEPIPSYGTGTGDSGPIITTEPWSSDLTSYYVPEPTSYSTSGYTSLSSETIEEIHDTVTVTVTDCPDETSSLTETLTSTNSDYGVPPGGYGTDTTTIFPTETSETTSSYATDAPIGYFTTEITSEVTETSTVTYTHTLTSTLEPYGPVQTPATSDEYGSTTLTDDPLSHTKTSAGVPEPSVVESGATDLEAGMLSCGALGVVVATLMFVLA